MQSRIYRFGQYQLDPTRHEFRDGDELVPLQLKVFECLAYLVEHRDRAVCRDELISAVWGKTDLNDNILSQIIGRARQAVGDSGEDQHTIRTVPRFGYCWVRPVDVHEAELDGDAEPVSAPPGDVPGRRRVSMAWMASLAMLGLFVWISIQWMGWQSHTGAEADAVLVLPVAVAGDDQPSWIRLGVMDLIAERLRESGMAVVPSDNTVALVSTLDGSRPPTPDEVAGMAKAAAASLVIDTTVEPLEQRWRVSLRSVGDAERPLLAQGEGEDVIGAAAAAADHMAVLLGRSLLRPRRAPAGTASELQQQVRAAILTAQFDQARSLLEQDGSPDDPRVRYQLADIQLRAGQYSQAREAFRALIRDLPPQAEPSLRAKALHGLAFTHIRTSGYPLAEPYVIEAMGLLEGADGYAARNVLGELLMARAFLQRVLHRDLDAARADYARARVVFEGISNRMAIVRLDANLGMLLHDFGRNAEAIPLLERAAERHSAYGYVQSELRARFVLALAHYWSLDAPSALAEAARIDALLARANEPHLAEQATLTRLMILSESGQLVRTSELLAPMLEVDVSDGQVSKGMWPEYIAARNALAAGRTEEAARYAKAALARPWGMGVAGNVAHTWWVLVRAELAAQRPEAAADTVAAADQWAVDHEDNPRVGHFMELLHGEYALSTGNLNAAETHLSSAWNNAQTRGIPLEIMRAAHLYTELLIRQGDMETASLVAARVAAWADRSYRAALLQVRLYQALGEPDAWRSALAQAQALAGDRRIPSGLLEMTVPDNLASASDWQR